MRFSFISILCITLLNVAGCSDSQSVQGTWECSTTHPGGGFSNDIFKFSDNGTMTLDSDSMVMHGSYTQDGNTLTMQLLDVPVPDPSGKLVTQPQTLTATLQKKSAKGLEMNISTGKQYHLSRCRGG